jgi:XrtN system VIT domain protein
MNKQLITFASDGLRLSGLLLILTSSLVFGITLIYDSRTDLDAPIFIANYAITVIYTFSLLIQAYSKYRWKFSKSKMSYTIYMLILWFISAFSLNREITIFQSSTNWLSIYICIATATLLLSTFYNGMAKIGKHVCMLLMGSSVVLFVYYAIYLVPFYALGLMGAIFIGLTIHLLIPLFLVIATLLVSIRSLKAYPKVKYAFISGIILPLVVCSWFTIKWNNLHQKTTAIINHGMLNESTLPIWTLVSQHLPQSIVTEKMMKSGFVYAIPSTNGSWFWGDFGGTSFAEQKKHDPLVMIASFLIGQPLLDEPDRIKVLKAMYDSRHPAQERLWSGNNLKTETVVSNVKIYPEYRLAFTEKTLSIKNTSKRRWTGNEESIYTFQLSEGSVVSSLSLWINGIEEKARLTTKGKADTAYKTIVGIERKDPSVVHWQEGNKITVRISPCNTSENRRFRIGITSPLKKDGNRLRYENPSINGPESSAAEETLQISFSKMPQSLESPFPVNHKGGVVIDRKYKNEWQVSFASVPLSNNGFSFNGSTYKLQELRSVPMMFSPERIYLDVNSSWTEEEFKAIWNNRGQKEVYVFHNEMKKLETETLDETFNAMHELNYSLFPFYLISKPNTSLVITKGTNNSANLKDLEGSLFQKRTTNYFAKGSPLHVYNIGFQKNAYIRTLKEFGAFEFSEGVITQALDGINKNVFYSNGQQEGKLDIDASKLSIHKVTDSTVNGAPDHLLRLYAYNEILHGVGKSYFEPNYVSEVLIQKATEAYVVSPVSSLIVLETTNDYNRFGIEESKNSLQNASINSSGAAPEPHEWLLIVLGSLIVAYYLYKARFRDKLKTSNCLKF